MPTEQIGRGNFVKSIDQNFPPPIITGQSTPLTKLSPYFSFPLIFVVCTINKKPKGKAVGGILESESGGKWRPF